jgi:pimeloyl-ACP methyl ester carboxylesterase
MSDFLDLHERIRGLDGSRPPALPAKVLVFVHGIFSDHTTFLQLTNGLLEADETLRDWGKFYYDYDFNRPILDNGCDLAKALGDAFPDRKSEITIVAHSMGGLVARAALLQKGDLGMVKRLVMLATPNHGTLQTARLGLIAHLLRETTGVLWTVFARSSTGILELTQPGKTLEPLITHEGVERTLKVEYVTIPAMSVNEESGWFDTSEGASTSLGAFSVFLEIMNAIPGIGTKLRLPNDGIVEALCVRLSSIPGFFSERNPAIGGLPRGPYLHVEHKDYKKVDHVHVHRADRTIKLLAELLAAPELQAWRKHLAEFGEYTLHPP